jgi:hypothetical protein
MASIVIFPVESVGVSEGNVFVSGNARLSNDGQVDWSAAVPANASAEAWNEAIKNAAVSSAAAAGYTVGEGDRKTIVGGAVDA